MRDKITKIHNFVLLISFFLLYPVFIDAQHLSLPYGSLASEKFNYQIKLNQQFHPSIKPFHILRDSLINMDNPFTYSFKQPAADKKLKILPVVEAGYRQSLNNKKNLATLGLGGEAFYTPHPNLTFHAMITERYTELPSFQNMTADTTGFIPHFGKYQGTKNEGYLYPDIQASVHWKLNHIFSLELGNERQFLGEGHRSLFLSANSKSFPYLRGTIEFWNLKYFHQVGMLRDINNEAPHNRLQRKNLVLHYLSWNISKSVNVGLFEAIVWRHRDSTYNRGIDPNYFNPVIFLRPVEFVTGSEDNALMGLAGNVALSSSSKIYGQFIIDEFNLQIISETPGWWGNKHGLQLGMKTSDLLGIKGLDGLAEYSQVRPFTYAHANSLKNYGNQFEPLAHPLGSNFREALAKIFYQRNQYYLQGKFIRAWKGEDPSGINLGSNIYRNYNTRETGYGNEMLQGIKSDLTYWEIRGGYQIIPQWGLALEGRILGRSYTNKNGNEYHLYFQLSLNSTLHDVERFFY